MLNTLLSPETVVKWHPNHVAAEINGDIVLMSITQGKYIGLDDVASAVWRNLAQPLSIDTLSQRLATTFSGNAEQIQHDIQSFLADMIALSLVEIEAGEISASPNATINSSSTNT